MKKEKIIYDNQEEILEHVISFLKFSLKEDIKEAYLFGSIWGFGRGYIDEKGLKKRFKTLNRVDDLEDELR